MAVTDSIIHQIEDLGYAVSTHRMPGYVEMHAVPLSGEGEVKLARCGDGDDDEACYRCAVELARMVDAADRFLTFHAKKGWQEHDFPRR
jgi:hypothetical protein